MFPKNVAKSVDEGIQQGIAGVPRATLVILVGTASSFGLPEWPSLVLLGIDALTDKARTSVNVIGNCLATVVVARWEGEYPPLAPPTSGGAETLANTEAP